MTEVVIPRKFGFAFPRTRTNLRYSVSGVINNPGSTTANNRYRPTAAFDVDPLFLTAAMPGYASYALLYQKYRVRQSTIRVHYINNETFGLVVGICPTNTDLGSNHAGAVTVALFGQPESVQSVVGGINGNNITKLTKTTNTAQFAGSNDLNVDDQYVSRVTSTPLQNWFFDVYLFTGSNILVNGLTVHVILDVEVEFFELAAPTS